MFFYLLVFLFEKQIQSLPVKGLRKMAKALFHAFLEGGEMSLHDEAGLARNSRV